MRVLPGDGAVVTSTAVNPQGALVYCTATTIPAAGVASFLYSNGSGVISASAGIVIDKGLGLPRPPVLFSPKPDLPHENQRRLSPVA